ncbi:chymotrypsin-1-like isoform X1 [Dermacentor variabilis]|uniref:chymotrypsin-1-like isoform X1 n=1 Tax=Dermacentor variabilis TaxID=34621 RepID=UPI003F5B9A14
MASLRSDYVPWYTQLYLTKVALVIFVMALPATANEMATNLNQAGCGELGSKGRIYHGKPTSKEDMPWIVQVFVLFDLSSDRGGGCGGSIITRNVILTAAHCLFVKGTFAQKVTVVYKSHLYNNGKAVQAEKMMLHPKYVSKLEIVHDIALLKLAVDLEFNRQVKPVCLPTAKMDLAGKTLVVAGWGSTESANRNKTLLQGKVVALPEDLCQALIQRVINPSLRRRTVHPGPAICASGEGQGVCDGDSGGPLTLRNDDGRTMQVGVVSFGPNCLPLLPAVYTSVSSHIKWIQGALKRPRKWRKLQYTRKKWNLG